jgi:two-component system cell cycle response regulator
VQTDNPYRVLLIEQDPEQTELYAGLIREVADCQVDVLSRVESAFDWIARSNYQLIVIDISSLGGAGGLSLLEQVKRLSPVTSVVLISETATVEQAVAAIRMGAEDYLKKPFGLEAFQLAVKRGLDRKAVFGDEFGASGFINLLTTCQMISASLEQGKIMGMVQSFLARELKSSHTAVYELKGGAESPTRLGHPARDGAPSRTSDRAMEEILDIALQASNPLPRMAEAGEAFRFVERGQLTPGMFIFRFRCAGNSDYFCVCLSPAKPSPMEEFEGRLRMLRAQIEVTGRNIEEYEGVQQLVYMDDATGLYNTRYLHNILDREIANSESTGRSFAVLFIDADKFKAVNDGHGHLVGTQLLNELGEQLKRLVRANDTVFRYGGDEFVAVLSSCDLHTAKNVAERIRAHVEKHTFIADEGLNLHFTVSIGVALFPDHATSKKDLIHAADHAMYDVKKSTRNSVTIAPLKSDKPGTAASATARTPMAAAPQPQAQPASAASGASKPAAAATSPARPTPVAASSSAAASGKASPKPTQAPQATQLKAVPSGSKKGAGG